MPCQGRVVLEEDRMGRLSSRWGPCVRWVASVDEYGDRYRGRCSELEHPHTCSLTSCPVRRRRERARPMQRLHVEHIGRWTAAVVARELLGHSLIGDHRAWTHRGRVLMLWRLWSSTEDGWPSSSGKVTSRTSIRARSESSSGWNTRRVGSGRAGCPRRRRGQESVEYLDVQEGDGK